MTDSLKTQTITIVGGGPKKVLYTLKTLGRIGLLNSAKALNSRNTCKACGLGMGGQQGGMTNELGEFPSVCNKSIQAQSTDIQPPIPPELFEHAISDFAELSAYELEHLGRLNNPLYKSVDAKHYQPVSWDFAISLMSEKFRATPANRSFFYASGRSSNEAGFLLQILARLYGTNNINNCSYYCHQATGVGLQNVLGTGTATLSLDALQGSDCIFVIGANPASNHPRFIHQLLRCRERGGQVIVINPAKEPGLVRFAVPKSPKSMLQGGSWIASEFLQPRIGSDAFLLAGIAKSLIERNQIHRDFIESFTENSEAFFTSISELNWPDIVDACDIEQTAIEQVAQVYANSENTVFAWGMGITHHTAGVDNVELIANLALLRGMIGKPHAGLLPLRGHSNVQGIGTMGVKPELNATMISALETHLGVQFPKEKGMDTLACLKAADDKQIDAALLLGGNLLSATPNTTWARQALDKINFKVYLTTTLNRGHVEGIETSEALVLPVAARDEEWQPTTQESMFNFVRLSDGGITRLNNVKSEVEILSQFAQRLLPNAPIDFALLKNHDAIRAAIAEFIPGMENIKNISETKQEFTITNRLLEKPLFPTPSGRAQFANIKFSVRPENKSYPFTLASIRSEGQFNSIIYEEADSYRGANSRWSVLMNQQDMNELSVSASDKVTLTSPYGIMRGLQPIAFAIPRGNLLAYYPESNCLIGLTQDERSKTPAFKSVAVALEKDN